MTSNEDRKRAEEEDRRGRIVEAADRLYYSRGFSSVSMDELRDEAGVSLRRLYKLFPSKDDIIIATLRKRRRVWAEGIAEYVDAVRSPRDKLLAVYDFLAGWFCEDDFRGCGFVNAFAELGAVNTDVADLVREHKAHFQRDLARLVEELGAEPSLAAQLAILAEGAQTTAAVTGDPGAAGHARAAAATLIDAALDVDARQAA
ncbi:TetR/AcrR family transcriptional regulator [Nocardiopsis sp. NRRL B-16309]|uniref:TetR/AcrR family transcriptional regulator n=1 Tax=Nocardiopsis sp. NRRL B-16309 TaxID=1519494 RepID=UPI0006AE5AB9|nr:TetR/AcrR family transcriptional regulator [Nocardiopsis sp. NRRL B-16309]KOX13853.1 TetR family transcriptional regulator [Nocardiopsis sp. NRRL B-16309]